MPISETSIPHQPETMGTRKSLVRKLIVPTIFTAATAGYGATLYDHAQTENRVNIAVGQLALPHPSQAQLDNADNTLTSFNNKILSEINNGQYATAVKDLSSPVTQEMINQAHTLKAEDVKYKEEASKIAKKYDGRLHLDDNIGFPLAFVGIGTGYGMIAKFGKRKGWLPDNH